MHIGMSCECALFTPGETLAPVCCFAAWAYLDSATKLPPPTLCRWSGDSAPEPGILSSHAPADFMSVERRLKSAGETPALLCPSPRFGSGVKMRPCRFAGGRLYCGLTANSLLCAGLARCNAKRLAIRDSRDRLYRRYFPLAFSRRAGRYVPEKFSKR